MPLRALGSGVEVHSNVVTASRRPRHPSTAAPAPGGPAKRNAGAGGTYLGPGTLMSFADIKGDFPDLKGVDFGMAVEENGNAFIVPVSVNGTDPIYNWNSFTLLPGGLGADNNTERSFLLADFDHHDLFLQQLGQPAPDRDLARELADSLGNGSDVLGGINIALDVAGEIAAAAAPQTMAQWALDRYQFAKAAYDNVNAALYAANGLKYEPKLVPGSTADGHGNRDLSKEQTPLYIIGRQGWGAIDSAVDDGRAEVANVRIPLSPEMEASLKNLGYNTDDGTDHFVLLATVNRWTRIGYFTRFNVTLKTTIVEDLEKIFTPARIGVLILEFVSIVVAAVLTVVSLGAGVGTLVAAIAAMGVTVGEGINEGITTAQAAVAQALRTEGVIPLTDKHLATVVTGGRIGAGFRESFIRDVTTPRPPAGASSGGLGLVLLGLLIYLAMKGSA